MMLNDEIAFERKTIPQAWPDLEKAELIRLRTVEGRDWAEIAARLGRSEAAVKSKFKYIQCERSLRSAQEPSGVREPVPARVLADRDMRIIANRSLTASVFGDPSFSQSALAKKIEVRTQQPMQKVEKWKPVKGYEGTYEVSSLGRIKRLARKIIYRTGQVRVRREKILNVCDNGKGCIRIVLFNGKNRNLRLKKHLVADAFVPNLKNSKYVFHINGIETDFRAENLAWRLYESREEQERQRSRAEISSELCFLATQAIQGWANKHNVSAPDAWRRLSRKNWHWMMKLSNSLSRPS